MVRAEKSFIILTLIAIIFSVLSVEVGKTLVLVFLFFAVVSFAGIIAARKGKELGLFFN